MTHEPFAATAIFKNLAYIPAVFLGLSLHSYGILAALMVIDFVTGIARSYVLHGGASITSQKAVTGLITKSLCVIIPAVIAMAGIGAGIDLQWFAQSALGMLILANAYSIIGNTQAVITKDDTREFDAVAHVIGLLKNLVEKVLSDEVKGK